jgi:hypothetical protein
MLSRGTSLISDYLLTSVLPEDRVRRPSGWFIVSPLGSGDGLGAADAMAATHKDPQRLRADTSGPTLFSNADRQQPGATHRPYEEGLTTTTMPSQQTGRRWPTARHTLSIAARDIPLPELMA